MRIANLRVLSRHFPELTPILQRSANSFAPWKMP